MSQRPDDCGVDGVSLAMRRFGQGRPVVCLHAIGHDSRDFEALRARIATASTWWPGLARARRVGAGPGERQRRNVTAACSTGLLESLDLPAPILIGNSIGGAAAILSAAALAGAGHAPRGLVLCDSGGLVAVTPLVSRFCALFERFFAAGERGAWWYGGAYSSITGLVLPGPRRPGRGRREIVAQGRALAPLLRQAWASFSRPEADIRAVAAGLDIPVWAAWGRQGPGHPAGRLSPGALEALKHAAWTRLRGRPRRLPGATRPLRRRFPAWAGELRPEGRPPAAVRPLRRNESEFAAKLRSSPFTILWGGGQAWEGAWWERASGAAVREG